MKIINLYLRNTLYMLNACESIVSLHLSSAHISPVAECDFSMEPGFMV